MDSHSSILRPLGSIAALPGHHYAVLTSSAPLLLLLRFPPSQQGPIQHRMLPGRSLRLTRGLWQPRGANLGSHRCVCPAVHA